MKTQYTCQECGTVNDSEIISIQCNNCAGTLYEYASDLEAENSDLRAQLAEARKDSELLDYFEHRYLNYQSYFKNEKQEHEIEYGNGNTFTGSSIREVIRDAMKGGE